MHPSRLLLVVPAAVAPLLVAAVATPAGAVGGSYVALGDSYSSGVGTGNYYSDSGSCKRSPQSYPPLWATAHSVSSFTFAACSGAKTGDVLANQLGGLNSGTTIVTITIGGNDAGWSTVMTNCITQSDSGCRTSVTNAEIYVQNTLPGLLDNVYNAIHSRAPAANVVVLGYPRFYTIGGSCIVGLSDTKRGYIDEGADVLDTVTAAAAGRHGFIFGDVRSIFAPHQICSSGTWWLHSLDWFHFSESYHPTSDGYRYGYLPVLTNITG
jgi:lysophospholipase L1-like esterase